MDEIGLVGRMIDMGFMIHMLNNLPEEHDVNLDSLETHLMLTRKGKREGMQWESISWRIQREQLFLDISSPSTKCMGDEWRWLLVVDDCTDYCWSYFLKEESELKDHFLDWLKSWIQSTTSKSSASTVMMLGKMSHWKRLANRKGWECFLNTQSLELLSKMWEWNENLQLYIAKLELCWIVENSPYHFEINSGLKQHKLLQCYRIICSLKRELLAHLTNSLGREEPCFGYSSKI